MIAPALPEYLASARAIARTTRYQLADLLELYDLFAGAPVPMVDRLVRALVDVAAAQGYDSLEPKRRMAPHSGDDFGGMLRTVRREVRETYGLG